MKPKTPHSKPKEPVGQPQVGVIMGSDSDWPTMKLVGEARAEFDVSFEARVVSAHRAPGDTAEHASTAVARGLTVIVAGAGGAAHLSGMVARHTPLPVIGVPIQIKALNGLDLLLSILQMPCGIPGSTGAIGNGRNAGLLAVQILGVSDICFREKILKFRARLADESRAKNVRMKADASSAGGIQYGYI